ncbi:MAG: hypothetical protein M1827_000233 [Pycnora praestabilis]|nr:MAG: hypothetical protein M1827_000233 [Pycnora praestabilis]
MPGRFPLVTDFPSSLVLTITPPPSPQPPTNVLILLHGLGDTNTAFTALGRNLCLPETACISLQAPTPLPFDLGGFHWGDDIIFDQASGKMDFDTGFDKARKVIGDEVILKGLTDKCGYQRREIMIFGFGQGGMAGLAVAAYLSPTVSSSKDELGGVISIGGPLPSLVNAPSAGKAKTHVIVLGGHSNTLVTSSAITTIKNIFGFVEFKQWKRAGDGMPTNRDEMMPIMQFFAQRLRSGKGVPQGSVEIG